MSQTPSPVPSPQIEEHAPSTLTDVEIKKLHEAPKEEGEVSHTLDADQAQTMKNITSEAIRTGNLDPTGASLPSFMFRAESGLESTASMFNNYDQLLRIKDGATPLDRMLRVAGWIVGFVATAGGRSAKKPFNPVLGEVFRKHWATESHGKTKFVGEQVSHHPPRSASAIFNQKAKTFVETMWEPKLRFWVTSVVIHNLGRTRLTLAGHDEVYELTMPSVKISGILWGKMLVEWVGHVQISCEKTGLTASIDFKEKPWFRGKYHCIGGKMADTKGTLYNLEGRWNDQVHATPSSTNKSGQKQLIFDNAAETKLSNEGIVRPLAEQDPFESQRMWEEVAKNIRAEKWKEANAAKQTIENAQRMRMKEMSAKDEAYTGKLFVHVPDAKHSGLNWQYKRLSKLIEKAKKTN